MEAVEALALVGGHVSEELLLRNEYLAAENEILRSKIKDPIRLKNDERIRLAEIGKKIGLKALKGIGCIVAPETILKWYRELIAKKFDGSKNRNNVGRPPIDPEVEALVVRFAKENPSWGYDKIAGALANLGYKISDQTVGNILKKYGITPAPDRDRGRTWSDFIKSHEDVLAACDFFTVEVITPVGLMTYYVLFFIHIGTREVHIAGMTPNPDEVWMKQMARNVTMTDWGFLSSCKYLILDRDTKFCESFRSIIESGGVKPLKLPPKSPDLNAFAERWVLSVKSECLSNLIFFGEESLKSALEEYRIHYHEERNHQGIGNVIPFPSRDFNPSAADGAIECRERLGGMLKYYYRDAA